MYTSSQIECIMEETAPFVITIEKDKIPWDKVNKGYANLYEGKFKTLLEDTKVGLHKWKVIPCSWIG